MSETTCCSFCESLPTIARPSRGAPSKCPLCKQAHWKSPDGATCRIDYSAPAPSSGKWLVLGAALLGVALTGSALAAYLLANRTEFLPTPTSAPLVMEVGAGITPMDRFTQATPSVRTKPRLPEYSARVKPGKETPVGAAPIAPVPVVETKSAVKPPLRSYDDVQATVKTPLNSLPLPARLLVYTASAQEVERWLAAAPQVDIVSEYAKKRPAELAKLAREFSAENKESGDGFVHKLQKDRADLAGLPFLMGKDCKTEEGEAKVLREGSLMIRRALSSAEKQASKRVQSKSSYAEQWSDHDIAAAVFWEEIGAPASKITGLRHSLPAFKQILMGERTGMREGFAKRLIGNPDALATRTLAQLAVFDTGNDVRAAAIEGLRGRPTKDVLPLLVRGFRYPFAPAAQNAAQAIVALELREAVNDLVTLLEEPDPARPFAVKQKDGQQHFVRELVRVNHHRNCMLCHATVDEDAVKDRQQLRKLQEMPLGPVTSMFEPLPPSSTTIYYSVRPGITLVRADVTYLRQDFSVVQQVEDSKRWPGAQRFDFLVRTRALTAKEAADYTPPEWASDQQQSIIETLRALTGVDHAPNPAAWRRIANPVASSAKKAP